MNRIYKVIWSKVKHQYVVVSELAHRDGKRSSAASKSVRTLLAVLAVCGMTAFGLGMQDVYAGQGEGVTASAGQYVAIGEASYKDADNYNWWEGYNPNKTYTQNIDEHTYIYTKTEAGNFWVREGYTIKVAHDQRFPGTNEGIDTVIETYKGENADTTGILQSYQNVESNMGVSTLNGKHLQTTTTDMYVGAVNTPTTEITSAGNQFYIYRGSHWVNVGQDNFASNFNYRDVIYDEATGLYTFHGEVVSTENLYSINGNVGVFTTTPGGTEVYTGDVYGWNNEILVTGVDEDGNYVSYWGSENVDPNAPIGNMPMSTLQYKFDVVNDNIEAVAEDNIKQINIGQSGNDGQVNISKTDNGQGGTIGLQTNGTFDEDGNPTGGAMIPGGIKITSEHGNDGKDVRIKFANDAGSFTVDAGSKVVGRTDAGVANEGDTLTSVDINGKNYLLGGGKTYTAGNNINIDDNNVISTTKTTVSADNNFIVDSKEDTQKNVTDYNIKLNNVVTIGSGEGSHPVKIDGVNGQVTGLTNTSLDVDGFGESNRAATEEQLKAVSDKVGEVSIEAEKHSTVTGDKENITVIPEEQADGHLNYEVTLHDNLYLSGENDAFVQVLGTAGKINLGGGNNIISIDGALGQISGLSNLTWNPMKNYEGSSLAATESQLHDAFGYLNDKIDSIDITGDDNITVDKSENTSEGSGSGSGSTGEETTGKGPHFDIGLKDDVTLGTTNEDGDVTTSGSLTIKDTSGNTITINQKDETGKGNGLVSGLTNTDWDWNKYGKPVAEGGYAGSTNAATESQLNGAIEGVMESTVQYDKVKDEDGNVTVDKSHITLNEGGTTITNVAAGKNDMDAVNYSQLKNVQQQVTNNSLAINNIGSKVGELDSRIDKVGAGAAALAALHPLDFDPDDKWDFAAGYGNYRGESAVAIGAFYRPNEDTMFSVGGTVGNDDNMVNAGVSFKIGQGSGISTSRVAMAKEIKAMRDVVAKQDAQIQKLTAMVNALVGVQAEPDTTTMFPDVPENHWAYEAVASMAKSGLVEGYPDGEFKGDRTMTRYEFAQIIQNAIQKGAEVDARLVQEFKPELEYFHIATVAKDKDGNPTIERVRAN